MTFEEIDVKTMKLEDFCFRSFFLLTLSHGKNRTVKGGLGESQFTFPK